MIEFQHITLSKIQESPFNPRKHFNAEAMSELVESVKGHGVIQPILVRPIPLGFFQIVAGARRFRAANDAGLATIPAIVREMDEQTALEAAVIENLQREDVHPLEEAEGYERLMQHHGYTADTLAAKIGKSRAYVYARVKLIALAPAAREMFYDGKLTPSVALLIARIPGTTLQVKAAVEVSTPNFQGDAPSYRRAVEILRDNYMLNLDEAHFKPNDAKLVPAAGSCTDCPKRSGNDLFLAAEINDPNVCTDPACFSNKREVNFLRLKTLAEKSGNKLITGKDAESLVAGGNYTLRQNGYTPLDTKVEHDPQGRTVRELLGKNASGIASIENARQHTLIDAVDTKTLAVALKKAGIEPPTQPGKFSREDNERDEAKLLAKIEAEKAWRGRLFQAVRLKIGEPLADQALPQSAELTALAINLFMRLYDECDLDEAEDLMALWGKPVATDDEREYEAINAEFCTHLATLDGPALCLFLVDLSLIDEVEVSRWHVQQDMQPTRLLGQAKRLGIDADALRKSPPKTTAKKTAQTAPTPLTAAQAHGLSADEKNDLSGANEAVASKVKSAKAKPKSKSNPASASPPNEPPLAANPTDQPFPSAWPFPTDTRTSK